MALLAAAPSHAQLGQDFTDAVRALCRKNSVCASEKSREYNACPSEACKLAYYDKTRRDTLSRNFQEAAERRCQESTFIDQKCVERWREQFNRCIKMSCQEHLIQRLRGA